VEDAPSVAGEDEELALPAGGRPVCAEEHAWDGELVLHAAGLITREQAAGASDRHQLKSHALDLAPFLHLRDPLLRREDEAGNGPQVRR
jgi:hypothetical protein